MMGTLAALRAGEKIPTPEELFRAEVEGNVESVVNVLKIRQIRVICHLKIPLGKTGAARDAMSLYLSLCPEEQSLRECTSLWDSLVLEDVD